MASSVLRSAATFGMFSGGCPNPPCFTDRIQFNNEDLILGGPNGVKGKVHDPVTSVTPVDTSPLYPSVPRSYAGTISAVKPTVFSRMAQSSNFFVSMGYGVINGANLASYFFTPWRGEASNLDGSFATSRERVIGFTTTAAAFYL
jgi:hypothetical protein